MKEKPVSMTKLKLSKGKLKVMKCDTCKKEFLAGGIEIKEQKVTPFPFDDAEEIQITFFRCPHCNHAYVITLDNDETLALRNDYQLLANRLTKQIQSRKVPKESQMLTLERKKQRLTGLYEKLKDKYPESTYRWSLENEPDLKS